ncbi:MAG: response regulator transcription factor [Xanthomonadales bacterium]|nr:response regulator transcription factor [Xanthomonadales bacterium]MCB1633699.1 response regulator transcription factor [Xanthomonadales bacterium]MCB1640192.1 response regulator transcription factor [Xanthomonadales bacterium]
MSPPIRLLLVDDHAVVREGLKALLEEQPDMRVVAEYAHASELIDALPTVQADVLILDLRIPGSEAAETIGEVKRLQPALAVLVFTSFADDQEVLSVLDAGAEGYLLKDALGADLLRALRLLAEGESWLDPSAQRALVRARRRQQGPLTRLTPRERDVLQLLTRGASNRDIAQSLGLTERTVKGYLTQIFEKLDVRDRTQAALLAVREAS